MKKWYILLVLVGAFMSCKDDGNTSENIDTQEVVESMSFTTLGPDETGIDFLNTISESDSFNFFNYEYIYNGGGVAVGDINNDGLADIYFTGNQVSDKLYLNKGDLKFEDITSNAIGVTSLEGWHTGVSMVDLNQDGWLDIYVCRSGLPENNELLGNLLYINNGDNTFTEKAKEYGVDVKRKTTQAAFFDYDNDGDLDLYVLNHPNQDSIFKSLGYINDLIKKGSPDSDMFLENQDGKFVDVSREVGINNNAYGLGITVSDLNGDGFMDLYVSNDYMAPDFLYINNGKKGFTDESQSQLNHMSNYSMGNEIADINNDGFLDIMSVDMASEDHVRSKKNMGGMSTTKFWETVSVGYHYQFMFNALQLNNGNGTYSDISLMAGVSKTDWSWAPLFVDFDNDGFKDLFITNGYRRDSRDNDYVKKSHSKESENATFQEKLDLMPATKVQNYIYKNDGELHFHKKMEDWNLNTPVNSNGAAYADFDNDGDIDLVINNMEDISSVLRNDLVSNNNYVKFKIVKNDVVLYGTKVKILVDDQVFYQELQVTRGYISSVDNILHFGLGEIEKIDRLEITWPDGSQTLKKDVAVNQLIVLDFKKETKNKIITPEKKKLFKRNDEELNIYHKEVFVNDFEIEVLLPNKMSQLGPFISKGDVDGDGLEDFYLSGSARFSGQLYIQNNKGGFKLKAGPWSAQKYREEMDSEFFDIDNDGDLDLYVVSGGNEVNIRNKLLNDQLYINDGKGNFTNESTIRLPFMETSGQRITVGDYDNDGDIDVFVGGRQTPQFYPFAPRSYLLRNENGVFEDVTSLSKDIMGPGLITQSIFDDFDQDGDLDLICVGEWMPISFFENNSGLFTNVTKQYGFLEEVGWWNSITAGDFNGDGKNDYIIGNVGENNKFHPKKDAPLEIYCHDFDASGSYDIVLGKYQNNACYPVRGKQCSTEQMPFVSQKFPTYDDFAVADLEKIYGKENLEQSLHFSATNFSSVILMSSSSGFTIEKLNPYAQVSPLNAGLAIDINNDGNLDFIGVGNNFAAEVETVRYDAGVGIVLLGDGNGGFQYVSSINSGFFTNTDDKDLIQIGKSILVTTNNGKLKRFKILSK